MRATPSRLMAGALDLMKMKDRRRLEEEKGLSTLAPDVVLRSTREELGLDPLPPSLAKWAAAPPRKGGKAR